MRKPEQTIAVVIIGCLVLIALADTLRHLIGYLIVLAALLVAYRLLFRRDRG